MVFYAQSTIAFISGRERETERERERERQTDRDRQTDRQRHRERFSRSFKHEGAVTLLTELFLSWRHGN